MAQPTRSEEDERVPVNSAQSALVAVIAQLTRERGRLETDLDTALIEIGREEAQSRRAIEEGHRRLSALRELRREYEERRGGLSQEMVHREWGAVRDGLCADRDRFLSRAALIADAIASREASLNAELAEPELATLVHEYVKFKEAGSALAAMPPDYREAILTQHARVKRRLEPYIAAANTGPPSLAVEPAGVGLVASADPADGRPEALVLVLPVPYAVYTEWTARPEDLASMLAYRMVAATFTLLRSIGAADAPVRYVEVHGCLALQVWLGDHEVQGDLRERTLEHLAAAIEAAEEIRAANVELYTLWLRPELLGEEPS